MIKGLKLLGLVKGCECELFEQGIHKIFMPHSLGHFIGYRVHDVGYHIY
jgi:hypothetical protein